MTAVLEARQVTARYASLQVLEPLSFAIEPGCVVGLVGSNGAGKTTLIHRLLGLRSGSGEVLWQGRPLAPRRCPDPETVAVVWDTLQMHPGLAAGRYLAALADALRLPRTRPAEVLELVDLTRAAGCRIGRLSMGMRQRLGIAAALLARPSFLVLDEPGNGLDPEGLEWLADLLHDFAAAGGTVLLSSHQLAQLEDIADRLLVIDRGRLVADASLAGLTGAAEITVVECLRPDDLADAVRRDGGTVLPGRTVELRVSGVDRFRLAELAHRHGGMVLGLYHEQPSLADSFATLITTVRRH